MSRRSRQSSPDPLLFWKLTIFFLCAGLWLAGVVSGQQWLTGSAIILLGAAMLLVFLSRRANKEEDED